MFRVIYLKDENKSKLKRFLPYLLIDIILFFGSLLLALYLIANKVYVINLIFSILFIISSFGFGLIITPNATIIRGKIGNLYKNFLFGFILIGGIFFFVLLLEIFVPNFIFQLPQWSWTSLEYINYEFMGFLSILIVFGVGSFSICIGKLLQIIFIKKSKKLKRKEIKFSKNKKIKI
jgi:hypothetical protein